MFDLIVNGENKQLDEATYNTIGDIISGLRKERNVIISVKFNNTSYGMSDINSIMKEKIKTGSKLEIKTSPVDEFLRAAIANVVDYIDKVKGLLPEVSKNILTRNEAGFKAIKELADSLSTIENLKNNAITISGLKTMEDEFSEREEETKKILASFVSSLEKKSYIEISRKMENDIPKVLDYYRSFFVKVLKSMKKK